jgi:hypothetical protein
MGCVSAAALLGGAGLSGGVPQVGTVSVGLFPIPEVGATARYLRIVSDLRGTEASRLEVEHLLTVTVRSAETYTVRQESRVRSASGSFEGIVELAPSFFVVDAITHVSQDDESRADLPYVAAVEFAGVSLLQDARTISAGGSWTSEDVRFAATSGTSDGAKVLEVMGDSTLSKGSSLIQSGVWPALRQQMILLAEQLPIGDADTATIQYYSEVPPGGAEPPRLAPYRRAFETFRKTEVYYIGE